MWRSRGRKMGTCGAGDEVGHTCRVLLHSVRRSEHTCRRRRKCPAEQMRPPSREETALLAAQGSFAASRKPVSATSDRSCHEPPRGTVSAEARSFLMALSF